MRVLTVTVRYSLVKDQAGGTVLIEDLDPLEDRVSCSLIDREREKTTERLLSRAVPTGDGTTSIPFELQENTEELSVNVCIADAGRSWAVCHLMFLAGRLVAVDRVKRMNLKLDDCTDR